MKVSAMFPSVSKSLGAAAVIFTAGLLAGCVPYPFKGKVRTDISAAPPVGDSVTVIKASEKYDANIVTADNLKPLFEAVANYERPRGCWAYTVEETIDWPGKVNRTTVYRINPNKPPEEIVEVISIDGKTPADKEKTKAEKELRHRYEEEVKRASGKKSSKLGSLKTSLELGTCHMEANGNILKYTIIVRADGTFGYRRVCEVDINTGALVSDSTVNLSGFRIVGLISVNMEVQENFRTYALVPGYPDPFPRTEKHVLKGKFTLMNVDGTFTCTYSDYKKVTCYDDRFSVILGPMEVVK